MNDTKFNLYHTDRRSIMNKVGHDCLYYSRKMAIDALNSLTPFCFRPVTIESSDDDDDVKVCHGKRITFEQLKTNNVTINDLFQWNAVIEIIDLYQKYLRFPHLVNDSELYCNCSLLSRFGKSCQYDIDLEDGQESYSFTDLVLYSGFILRDNNPRNDDATCFIGLQCQTNLVCLDWRQICNGIVDCDHGEDEPEELCLQMESNQCHPEKEFRCQNGHCIPISMASSKTEICLDRSDRINSIYESSEEYFARTCLNYLSITCDETNYGWKKFSCNNGQYISYEDLTSKLSKIGQTCSNDYHLVYLREIFSTSDPNECWKSLICFIGFDYLYSDIICSKEDIQFNIEKYCPTEFFFPNNSVVYSFVFFFYDQLTDRLSWFNYSGPNYICYKKEYCPNYIFHSSTISKKNFTCFSVNQRSFSWKNFYEDIIQLFRPCFSSLISINNELLFECHLSHSLISISRVKDKKKDCFYNEDEDSTINLCSLNTNDIFHCLSNRNECIRQSLISDNHYDCIDGSDEYLYHGHYTCIDLLCGFRPLNERTLPEIYRFEELCDHVVNRHLFSQQSKETDETDCEYWPYSCYSNYTKCNQIWNCPNGHDELNCDNQYNDHIRKVFHCKSDEHYCIQLSNSNDINGNCIDLNRTGDGKMDCIGGTDEQFDSICVEKYPMDFQRRFHCLNSSLCIRIDQICDGISDCPFEDDELVCSALFQNNSSTFHCRNSSENPVIQCDKYSPNNQYCKLKEHLWFCDLRLDPRKTKMSSQTDFEEYPPIDPKIRYQRSDLNQPLIIPKISQISLLNNNLHVSLCKLGYLIKSSSMNHSFCFCPPSYYGTFCQYQSEHLTILLNIQTRYLMNFSTVFRLMVSLLNENQVIQSYDETVFTYDQYNAGSVYLIDLILERMTNLSLYQRTKSKYVRVDSYIIKNTSVQYISSWLFDISFPFLPVNRLATVLLLVNESFTAMYCRKRCGLHGKCMHYINWKEKEYCWCDQGWFGEHCQSRSSSDLCQSTSCSPHSYCIIINEEKKQTKCLCPLGKSGDQCYITHDPCSSNPCRGNGICLPLNERDLEYQCKCKGTAFGRLCSESPMQLNIYIESTRTDFSFIPVMIFIFGDSYGNVFNQQNRVLHTDVKLPTTLQMYVTYRQFGFVRMFYNLSTSSYYLISLHRGRATRSVNTSVKSENLCENVSDLFNETVLNEYSYLKRLKLYHLPCQQNHKLRCFFDEYRMCICTRMHHSDCHLFSHQYGICDYCENNGLCLTQKPNEDQWKFRCLCSDCSFGSFCQFVTGNYFFTLDMLIGIDMKTGNSSFNEQPTLVHLTLAFLLFLLFINVIFNTPSIFVFSKKKFRQVGCDLYLFYLTVVSGIGLILLFLRFFYMLIIQMYLIENILFLRIGCKSLEYLIRLIPSVFDWLTVCISIERVYTVIKDVQFTKIVALKTSKIARWIIFGVFLINILTTLHRPFYLKLVDEITVNDEPRGHPWCVLDFGSTSWDIYEKVINICHLILPFILNLLAVLSFIVSRVNFELTSTIRKNKSSRFTIIIEQIFKYKSLIISPIVILTLQIPRFVFTFTLACIKYPWQRYAHLISYFISFLPLTAILFIYIIPSPKYKQQLQVFVKKILGTVA